LPCSESRYPKSCFFAAPEVQKIQVMDSAYFELATKARFFKQVALMMHWK